MRGWLISRSAAQCSAFTSWSPQMRQSIGLASFPGGFESGSERACRTDGDCLKVKPAAKNWGDRVAWEMGMAMTPVFGRRQKSLAPHREGAIRRRATTRCPRPFNLGRESPFLNSMIECAADSNGAPDGGILKEMTGWAEGGMSGVYLTAAGVS